MARAKCSAVDADSNYAKIVGDKGYIVFGPINVPKKIEIYDTNGVLQDTITPPIMVNGYEYQVLECKRCLEEGLLESPMMPHDETLSIMRQMDSLRKEWGVRYPMD